MVDVLRKWEAHGMKMAKLGVAVEFHFTLRKRIILAETLDNLTTFEVDQEFQQVLCTSPSPPYLFFIFWYARTCCSSELSL
jgi:hypothetical protein